jgi:hypothetical protein
MMLGIFAVGTAAVRLQREPVMKIGAGCRLVARDLVMKIGAAAGWLHGST